MISDLDILRVAHLMMHEFGGDAELEAANCINRMRGHGDWDVLLTWARIQQTIALLDLRKTPTEEDANRPAKLTGSGLDYPPVEIKSPCHYGLATTCELGRRT